MMHALPYLIGFIVPLTVLVAAHVGGYLAFLTPLVFFVLTPILDEVIPRAELNLDDEQTEAAKANPVYDWLIRVWFPVQLAVMLFALWRLTTADFSWYETTGIVLSVGILGGTGINVAHELMHRKNKWDKALAELLTWSVTYTHFCVEHVYGHHKKVATPNDPATSRFNESIYRFLPRSLFGGVLSFWHIETSLVENRRKPARWYEDRRIRYPLGLVLGYTMIGAWLGFSAVLFWLVMGLIGSTMLEIVNYVEHYGLERDCRANGRFERVQPHHSWSSTHRITGWLLFGLPRHADHHFLASRPYPILRNHTDAPQLPAGYATMFLLALIPPLWFAVMNPRAEAVRNGTIVDSPAHGAAA